jgi:hypothetical protein
LRNGKFTPTKFSIFAGLGGKERIFFFNPRNRCHPSLNPYDAFGAFCSGIAAKRTVNGAKRTVNDTKRTVNGTKSFEHGAKSFVDGPFYTVNGAKSFVVGVKRTVNGAKNSADAAFNRMNGAFNADIGAKSRTRAVICSDIENFSVRLRVFEKLVRISVNRKTTETRRRSFRLYSLFFNF